MDRVDKRAITMLSGVHRLEHKLLHSILRKHQLLKRACFQREGEMTISFLILFLMRGSMSEALRGSMQPSGESHDF
jgi:hypothetical protein